MSMPLRKLPERFSETAIDDEIVVMQLDTGVFFSLSGTGRAIWLLLDGTRDRAALLAALAESYDQTADELAPEVDAFIAQLIEAGLIEAIN
jgi:hypothetical protein